MRFLLIVFFLALLWVSGWIVGSLHPAPPIVLDPIKEMIASEAPATDDVEPAPEEPAAEPPATTPTPELEPEPPAPTPTSSSGGDDLDQYRAWISEARIAHPYPESEQRMFDVMICESGGQAGIVNPAGPYTGLFQYVDGTWNGDWNTYRDEGITNARAQIFATALAWSRNMQSHWGCYTRGG